MTSLIKPAPVDYVISDESDEFETPLQVWCRLSDVKENREKISREAEEKANIEESVDPVKVSKKGNPKPKRRQTKRAKKSKARKLSSEEDSDLDIASKESRPSKPAPEVKKMTPAPRRSTRLRNKLSYASSVDSMESKNSNFEEDTSLLDTPPLAPDDPPPPQEDAGRNQSSKEPLPASLERSDDLSDEDATDCEEEQEEKDVKRIIAQEEQRKTELDDLFFASEMAPKPAPKRKSKEKNSVVGQSSLSSITETKNSLLDDDTLWDRS